jgi:hypothetical protein
VSVSIRISEELLEAARQSAEIFHRSPPQQIEHWAHLGQMLEPALSFPAQAALKRPVGRADLNVALSAIGSQEGQRRAKSVIAKTSARIVSSD